MELTDAGRRRWCHCPRAHGHSGFGVPGRQRCCEGLAFASIIFKGRQAFAREHAHNMSDTATPASVAVQLEQQKEQATLSTQSQGYLNQKPKSGLLTREALQWAGERGTRAAVCVPSGVRREPLHATSCMRGQRRRRRARARARVVTVCAPLMAAGGSLALIVLLWAILTGYWTALYEAALAVRGTNYVGECGALETAGAQAGCSESLHAECCVCVRLPACTQSSRGQWAATRCHRTATSRPCPGPSSCRSSRRTGGEDHTAPSAALALHPAPLAVLDSFRG